MPDIRPLVPDVWWVVITDRDRPLRYGSDAVVLFPSEDDARSWMGPRDLRVEPWDGVVLGTPRMAD